MPFRVFDGLYLIGCSILLFLLFHGAASPDPYGYDESDYMMATRLGFVNSYLDTNSLSFRQFVSLGLKAWHKELNRTELGQYVRSRHDPMFYRHYHGPLNSYWLIFADALGADTEHRMRLSYLIFHLLTFITIYLGLLWIWGDEFRIVAVAASGCYLFCAINITSILVFSSHGPFLWLSILSLFAISKLAISPRPKYFYVAAAMCSVAVCALEEFAMFLFVALAVTTIFVRKELFADCSRAKSWRVLGKTALVIAAVWLVIWPSSLLKLAIVQGFALLLFLSMTRHDFSVSPWQAWESRFHQTPVEVVALFVCVAATAVLFWRSRHRRPLLPFVAYGFPLMAFVVLKSAPEGSRFIMSLFAPFYVCGALLLSERVKAVSAALQSAAVGVLLAFMLIAAEQEIPSVEGPSEYSVNAATLFQVMREHPSAKVLVPALYLPALQYYFPVATIRAYPPDMPSSDVRKLAVNDEGVCLYEGSALTTAPARLACQLQTSR